MNEQDAEMLQQINQFLDAMSPPDPDGMYSVAKVDSNVDPVELYRQSLAMGSGHVWYVGTEKCATAITGNGPRAKANAEFYAAAPIFVRWLLDKFTALTAERDALRHRKETTERQIVANEARITELTRLKDELAEDASRERQRAEAAEARVVNWISTEERLPETQLRVLAVMLYDGRKPRIIRAMHIPAKTVECLDWEFNDAVVYDSESECHYLGAGWYELMEEGEYYYVGPLSDSVTHWAEMPELPEYFRQ